jgi:RNA-directed DNA polymerase
MKRRIIKGWLKAGVIDGEVFYTTKNGTPQGGLCKALHNPPYAKKVIMLSNSMNLRFCNNFIAFYFA